VAQLRTMSLMSASQVALNQQAGEKYSHTIEPWILNAAASSISTRISQSSPRSLSRPSSANSLGSTAVPGTALTTGTVLSQHSQISATQDIAVYIKQPASCPVSCVNL